MAALSLKETIELKKGKVYLPKKRKKDSNFSKRYSRLVRSINQEDTKVVVSLGGGGIRMFAHPTIFGFLEKLGVQDRISEIWGASGGAIIGYYYSMGWSPEKIQNEATEVLMKGESRITPSLFTIIKGIVVETLWSHNSGANLTGFHNLQSTLQMMVVEKVKEQKARYPFYCVAYNVEKNQIEVLTPQKIPEGCYEGFIYSTDPVDAITASSAIPILFVPKEIKDKFGKRIYADGGTGEEVPTISVYKKWLLDKELGLERRKRLLVIAVDLHPDLASLGFLDNWLIKKIPAFQFILMTVNLTDLMRKARIKEQKRVLINDPNVEMWELDFNLKGGGLMNVGLIPKVVEEAEKSFPKQFLKINDSLLG